MLVQLQVMTVNQNESERTSVNDARVKSEKKNPKFCSECIAVALKTICVRFAKFSLDHSAEHQTSAELSVMPLPPPPIGQRTKLN